MSDSITKRKFTKKPIPPDGGWGILICLGMALPFTFALGSMPSFGLLFNDFLTDLGEETSAVTIITSCFFCALSFAGLFTNTLFKKFSIRSVGVFGGTMYFLGSLMTVFVTSVEQLMITFSIFQGAGFGFMIPVAYTTFNHYFVNKRVVMMSVAQSLIGIGSMVYPIVVQFLMDEFKFRGAMAILAAINAHAIFGMLVMHPISWHYKYIKVPVDESKPFVNLSGRGSEVKIIVMSDDEKELPSFDTENMNRLNVPHRSSISSIQNSLRNSVLKSVKDERSLSLDPTQNLDGFDPNKRRISSISSLGNWTGAVIVAPVDTDTDTQRNGKWQKVVDFLDLTLLKDPIYMNLAMGVSFALYSDTGFFTLQPMYLFELGFSKADTAKIIAIGAAADLGSRVFMAIVSLCVQVKARYIYLAGATFTIIARFLFLNTFDFIGVAVITAIMGFLRTWIHVPLPLVFAEYLSPERFPSGYGLFMFFQGNCAFIIGPIVGWIRDITQSYVVCFHSLTFIMCLCAVPWFIEIALLQMCYKNRQK